MTSIFLLLAILLCFASCSKNNEDGQKLKYYTINNEDSLCVELIQKYNNYCLKNLDESYQIEIVEFDSEDTMLTKISTEIMAGKGPDIISLNQKLPFEKLIDNGSFADIDELAELYKSDIDFDDYNSTIMDCGIYNGKRYIIPIAYCPNILITTQEILDKYNNNYLTFSATNDEVFRRLLDLFDGKVGKPFSVEEKLNIEQEGEKRYASKIPPGYRDNKKTANRFGDLFVWKEIIGYSKLKEVDIIFVTHDQKEDWWNTISGKTIGPRIELRKEFYEETKKMFHMYTMSSFLSFFIENKGKSIDKTTIDEVELFASVMKKKIPREELKEYYKSLEDANEKTAAKLRFKIANLERKNKNRKSSINALHKKASKRRLSVEEEIALQRNEEHLINDTVKIEQLKERLLYLTSLE